MTIGCSSPDCPFSGRPQPPANGLRNHTQLPRDIPVLFRVPEPESPGPPHLQGEGGTFHLSARTCHLHAAHPRPRFVCKDSLTTSFFFKVCYLGQTRLHFFSVPPSRLLLHPLVTPRQRYKGMQQQKSFYTVTSSYINKLPAPRWIGTDGSSRLLLWLFLDGRNCRCLCYPLGSRFIRGLLGFC